MVGRFSLAIALGVFFGWYGLPNTTTAVPTLMNVSSSRISPGDYSDALAMSMFFYEAQKSGPRQAASEISGISVEWRGDALLQGDANMAGGYFDAGDFVKFGLPLGYTMTTLAWGVLEFPEGYQKSHQMRAVLAHLKHGAEYIMESYSERDNKLLVLLGDPYEDHDRWTPAELLDEMNIERKTYYVTPDKPGTEVACEFAAALAAIAEVFSRYGDNLTGGASPEYIDKLTSTAEALYKFGETYQGNYTKSVPETEDFYNSFSGYKDELAWGAAWLALRTQDDEWKTKAAKYYEAPDAGWVLNWDDKSFGVSYLMYDLFDDESSLKKTAKQAIQNDLDFWMNSVERLNGEELRILAKWGSNRYASTEAFLSMLWYQRSGEEKYLNFGQSQIDYILGDNADGFSYMIGFGSSYPQNPHHRAAHGSYTGSMNTPTETRHILYGALVGGHKDASGKKYLDERADYITNEVACDYNAGFSGALAGLVSSKNGGRGQAIPRETVGKEISAQSSTDFSGDVLTVTVNINQMTGWPPRRVALSAHFYLSMGALSPDQVKVELDQGTNSVSVAGSLKGSADSPFVQISWPANTAPFPGVATQNEASVTFKVKSTTGEWPGRIDDYSSSEDGIPIYSGTTLLGGRPPPGDIEPPASMGERIPEERPRPSMKPEPSPPEETQESIESFEPSVLSSDAVKFEVTSVWSGGFVADISGGKLGSLLEIRFKEAIDIEKFWGAELVVSEPHQFVFNKTNDDVFGFLASMTGSEAPKPSLLILKQ